MFSATDLRPQPTSRSVPNNAYQRVPQYEPVKKPKKANSEIRKQQNKIASRNYRKRLKQRLQDLQQRLKDGNFPEQAAQEAESERKSERWIAPECQNHRETPPPPFALPPNAPFLALASAPESTMEPVLMTSIAPYDSHLRHTSLCYPAHEESRSTSMYDTTTGLDISPWNVTNRISSVEYTRTTHSRREEIHPHTRITIMNSPQCQIQNSMCSYPVTTSVPEASTRWGLMYI